MREMETTVTQKGQVTIPAGIRSRLGLKPRDKVRFELQGDVVTLRPVPSKVLRWYGSVAPKEMPENFREIREDFEQGVAEEVDAEDQRE
ncbi:MAG: AbrB/MazE/SpoVT family DNA-binding domain-containing protein [Bacteroidetes bacterium]|nr:AbrB/MazE/SpoVT family DNA-binding domain-containing protein [Bacteroidota bacterium]